MSPTLCIVSFTPIYRDSRVLRQVNYLSRHYDLIVISHGPPRPDWPENVRYIPLPQGNKPFLNALARNLRMGIGAFNPAVVPGYREALAVRCDACLADEWKALPLAAEIARHNSARLVFDAHEYSPSEGVTVIQKYVYSPLSIHVLRKYRPHVNVMTTISPVFARRYAEEFGYGPVEVIYNAPEKVDLPPKNFNPDCIRIIHHGAPVRDRYAERMIETIALCDERYSLHLMFVNTDPAYLDFLCRTAANVAPGRVSFHDPVLPEEIVPRIADFDAGFNFIPPTYYQYLEALPNKFFEFIAAGLAVISGPNPSCAEIIRKNRLGIVSATFEPVDLASAVNQVTSQEWTAMQIAARQASAKFNAAGEMQKLTAIFEKLLS